MTGTSNLLLGIIAVSVLLMAVMQIGIAIAALRFAKKVTAITDDLQREVKPLIARVNTISDRVGAITDEVHRASTLATQQMQKIDGMVTDLSRRVGETSASMQSFLTGPFLKGTAVVTGLRAALAALLTSRPQPAGERDEEEDALFVG